MGGASCEACVIERFTLQFLPRTFQLPLAVTRRREKLAREALGGGRVRTYTKRYADTRTLRADNDSRNLVSTLRGT